jgi:glycerol-3-phosphate dehydrogenase
VSRNHEVFVSASGLVTIAGGKWTTYRKMAEDTLAHAIAVGRLERRECATERLRLHGYMERDSPDFPVEEHLRVHGTDAVAIREMATERPELGSKLHERLPYIGAEIAWATRHEMARTLEDALARRTRALLLDARASVEAARPAASIMAAELGRGPSWIENEVAAYRDLASGYML